MRVVTVLLCATTLAAAAVSSDPQCPPYDVLDRTVYLPHPHDCSLFLRCVAGRPALGRCPPGQHFSPGSASCDVPARALCKAVPNACSALPPQSSCPYRCTCLSDDKQSACPPRLEFPAELSLVDVAQQPTCDRELNYFMLRGNQLGYLSVRNATAMFSTCTASEEGMYIPHFGDCAKGFLCKNGRQVTSTCPHGYHLNLDLGFCDEPQYMKCKVSEGLPALTDCLPGVALSSCHHACTCDVQQGACPAQLRYGAAISIYHARRQPACLKGPAVIHLEDEYFGSVDIHPNTTKVSHCPAAHAAPVLFPDPLNCEKVLRCERGQVREIYCPSHMHYNPGTKRCGPPDPKVCQAAPVLQQTSPYAPVGRAITCPPASPCPATSGGTVAHLTDCTLFCRCGQGAPALEACPPGLHYNARTQACDSPQQAGCQTFCSGLGSTARGEWLPQSCTTGHSREGAKCQLTCSGNYNLVGSSEVTCTGKGWQGTGGLNVVSACSTPEEIAVMMVGKINTILNQTKDAALLFLLDESGSITKPHFELEKNFVSAMVNAFPLSRERSAGVITFSDPAATIDIGLRETSTCNFLSSLRKVDYSGGGTNIANAINVAAREISINAPNKKTLLFLVTDGKSQTDPAPAASNLRSSRHILFTIGVAGYDRTQLEPISSTHQDGTKLFFGLPDFKVFRVVAEYLMTHYNKGNTYNCP
ncbi:uncharacterized protein LOC134542359 [Bacillus rossius redtenbacheri]|uniref:uncharacterized protein LOC134542359 n=1 Tax=Bacillus rossius redtenbacheri TaxID=93214 RepID=UPI002FDED522